MSAAELWPAAAFVLIVLVVSVHCLRLLAEKWPEGVADAVP